MKSLTKLRLINWHLFANECIDFKNFTFLTGANGTGKSTLIDAIQVVMLADTSGRNFNKAANDKMGRSLFSYLRGDTGETPDGQILCLRPGRFTSYIALQFHDDKKNSDFVLGIVFDCYEDEKEEHHYFYLATGFPEFDFTLSDPKSKAKRPLTYLELAAALKSTLPEGSYRFFDSNLEYRDFLKHQLGDLPEKYFLLFKRAVGFSPITNISSFITEYVCDVDYHVDIAPMQNNIEQYKLLELEAKNLQGKIDELKRIQQAYQDFSSSEEDVGFVDYLALKSQYLSEQDALATLEKNLADVKAKKDILAAQIKEVEAKIASLKEQEQSALSDKIGTKSYSTLMASQLKKKQLDEKIAGIEKRSLGISAFLMNYLHSYSRASGELSKRLTPGALAFLKDEEKDEADKFSAKLDDFAIASTNMLNALEGNKLSKEVLLDFQKAMGDLHYEANTWSGLLQSSYHELSGKAELLQREIHDISSGNKPFDPVYLIMKKELAEALKARHIVTGVSSYCDLVDVKDESWSKAIEAYIYNQKFNLFVDEDAYEEACQELAKICRVHGFYQIAIVDTAKLLDRGFETEEGSVAEEIETSHAGARVYTDFLLGNLQKCDTFAEARASGNGLLRDCTGYRNYASFYLNERRGSLRYLGTRVDKAAGEVKNADLSALNLSLGQYRDLLGLLSSLLGLDVLTSSEASGYLEDLEEGSKLPSLREELSTLEEEIAHAGDADYTKYDDEVNSLGAAIKEQDGVRAGLLLEKGSLENQIASLEEGQIPAKKTLLGALEKQFASFNADVVKERYEPLFQKEYADYKPSRLKAEAEALASSAGERKRQKKAYLVDLRAKYVAEYHLSYDAFVEENNNEFDKDLTAYSTSLLPEYLEKIQSAHDKALKEFKDDFIYQLRTSFESIRSQIAELNTALKDVHFGRDSYRFTVEPNKDYFAYYQMITDDLLLKLGDAENEYFDKYQATMGSLFALISESVDQKGDVKEQILDNIAKFTDYRTYLNFDLLVSKDGEKKESSLSKTLRTQSGGETQTPFYIAILASFAQIYRSKVKDSDCCPLVIFDEAFSKMDGARIKESVGLLRSFNLQAIVSTPPEKISDVAQEVDLVLVTIRDGKKNRSYVDHYEELAKAKA
jgi:energy-coupling factor transporter ATP-binding protein EcfA2